jgi:polar amino acid transport system substrate-binding protein
MKNIHLLALMLFLMSTETYCNDDSMLQVRTIAISPYGIENKTVKSGIYYDLTNLLLKRANLDSEHYIYPYARIIHELEVGITDLTIMFKYKELEPHVEYIHPLPTLKNIVIGRKGDDFTSIESLYGLSIGYLRGAKFSDAIDNNDAIDKQTITDINQGVTMLSLDRVDAIIGPLAPILSAAKKLNLSDEFFGRPLIVSERTPWLQVSKKSLNKVSKTQLKAIFSEMLLQGELKKIKNNYQ